MFHKIIHLVKIIFPYFFILFYSCVEHHFFIEILPDGNYQIDYSAHGDKEDLLDFDFTLPSSSKWIIHSTIDEIEAESYDYTAKRSFNRKEKINESFYKGDSLYLGSLLKHPIHIKYHNWFFVEKYTFKGEFKGRSVDNKYPIIRNLVQSIDNPPSNWLHESLSYLLNETLDRSNIEWNTKPIIKNELKHWINNDLNAIKDSVLFEDLEYYKNLGIDIIMQPASPNIYSEMDSIFKLLEEELKITLELRGDDFEFELVIPGKLDSTNANAIYGDTLFWSFDLIDFLNDDYIMIAKSSIDHPLRKKIFFISFSIIIILIILIIIRKKLVFN